GTVRLLAPAPRFAGEWPLFFACDRGDRDLHSFPTRRSSDLRRGVAGVRRAAARGAVRRALGVVHVGGSRERRGGLRHVRQLLRQDRKSTRLNSSHVAISYAVFCLKKKKATSFGVPDQNPSFD